MIIDIIPKIQDFWGFVPEDHVVGKAWFIWLSYGKNLFDLRLNRMFRGIKALEK